MSNGLNQNYGYRVDELLCELSESRADERDTQSQIFQVISIMGTILGILFGTSTLLSDEKYNEEISQTINLFEKIKITKYVTPARILFILSAAAFLVAFFYVTYLGILNLLRHYHIQFIEDRLRELITGTTDDAGRGDLLHWNEYISPIFTKNITHISCLHAALSFFAYTGAIAFIILFSAGIVIVQFVKIVNVTIFDKFVLAFVVFVMVIVFVLFFHLSTHSQKVAQYACNTAHDNQKVKDKKDRYKHANTFRYLLRYFIYPKIQDLQKPAFVVLSYAFWIFYYRVEITDQLIWRLILLLVVFDFLVYQARYQINDIRGIKEDEEAIRKKGLKYDNDQHLKLVIKYSITVIGVKLILAVALSVFVCPQPRWYLLANILAVVIITFFYEFVKHKQSIIGVFILVGAGYPLRFFLGYYEIVIKNVGTIDALLVLCLVIATWAYGSFSSILAWTNEVVLRMQKQYNNNSENSYLCEYVKSHYKFLENIVAHQFDECVVKLGNPEKLDRKVLPLRLKGSIKDPWNVAFFLAVSIESILFAFVLEHDTVTIFLEVIMLLCLIIYIKVGSNKWFFLAIAVMCCAQKINFYLKYSLSSALIAILQLLFIITFFVLHYNPQLKKIDIHKVIVKICNILFGKSATDSLFPNDRGDDTD